MTDIADLPEEFNRDPEVLELRRVAATNNAIDSQQARLQATAGLLGLGVFIGVLVVVVGEITSACWRLLQNIWSDHSRR